MIYYLLSEKERVQLEDLLINELTEVKKLLSKVEGTGKNEMIKGRAIKERRDLLISLLNKISNNKEKTLNL